MSHRAAFVGVALTVAVAALPSPATAATMLHHVEAIDGVVLSSEGADTPLNPASVVKLATTLWALDELGPDRRFDTRLLTNAEIDQTTGTLEGDLWVSGGGDPDFHVESAYLVAERLNALGISKVSGRLFVDGPFWIGWEGGSERTPQTATARALKMARRLAAAWDPTGWDSATRRGIDEFRKRREMDGDVPHVEVLGGVAMGDAPSDARLLVLHRSKPLKNVLKRFNAYSNNDIERLGLHLGAPVDLRGYLSDRWGCDCEELSFSTLSGLGVNRMTSRQVVRLLRDLRDAAARHELELEDLLPVVGCDPGTLEKFERLSQRAPASVVGKTGTLLHTDGGTSIFAGLSQTVEGERLFSYAVPGSGTAVAAARRREESGLLQMIEASGGASDAVCPALPGYPDEGALVE